MVRSLVNKKEFSISENGRGFLYTKVRRDSIFHGIAVDEEFYISEDLRGEKEFYI